MGFSTQKGKENENGINKVSFFKKNNLNNFSSNDKN